MIKPIIWLVTAANVNVQFDQQLKRKSFYCFKNAVSYGFQQHCMHMMEQIKYHREPNLQAILKVESTTTNKKA